MDEPSRPITIESCEPTARGHALVLILSDGRKARYTLEACRREHVEPGMVADADLLERLEQTDREVLVHEAALRLLSHRARSGTEMRTRLAMRGFTDAVIDIEIDRLTAAGLLDDEAFARSWVADRQLHAPRGRMLLRYELLGKGIAPEQVDAAMGAVEDEDVALELARRRARRLKQPDETTFRTKVGAHLQRRGVGFEAMKAALDTVWREICEEADEPARNERFAS